MYCPQCGTNTKVVKTFALPTKKIRVRTCKNEDCKNNSAKIITEEVIISIEEAAQLTNKGENDDREKSKAKSVQPDF